MRAPGPVREPAGHPRSELAGRRRHGVAGHGARSATAFPEHAIAMAAIGSVAPLFEELTAACADEVLVVATKTEIGSLRHGAFDAALLFPNSFRSAWVARGRASLSLGLCGSFRTSLLTKAIARPSGRVHQSVYYADLVRGLGFAVTDSLAAHHRPSGNDGPCRRRAPAERRDAGDRSWDLHRAPPTVMRSGGRRSVSRR